MQRRQVGVELSRPLAADVHRPERVLEPRVLAARENPPGRLQLVDSPQSLQPGVIEQVLLGRIGVAPQPFGDLDIAVQGVGDQIDRVIAAS